MLLVYVIVGPIVAVSCYSVGNYVPANFVLLFVFLHINLLPHELGHALAAYLTGMDIFRITFGQGRRLAHSVRRGILIEFRAMPIIGLVSASPIDAKGYRWKQLIFIAGGPMTNLALCVAAFGIAGGWASVSMRNWTEHLSPWLMLATANALIVILNLIPRQIKALELPSDGKQIANFLTRPLISAQQISLNYFLAKTSALMEAGRFRELNTLVNNWHNQLSELDFLRWCSIARGGAGEPTGARKAMLYLLQCNPNPDLRRVWLLNAIAWDNLILGGRQLLQEADRFSAEAYLLAPWDVAVEHTRGWALAELGRVEEGTILLKKSLAGAMLPHNRALVLCTLAIAEVRNGQLEKATEYRRRAQRVDRSCGLLSRVANEIAGNYVGQSVADADQDMWVSLTEQAMKI